MSPSPPPSCHLCFLSCKLLNFKSSRAYSTAPEYTLMPSKTLGKHAISSSGCFTIVVQPLTFLPSHFLPRPRQLCPASDHITCFAEGGGHTQPRLWLPHLHPTSLAPPPVSTLLHTFCLHQCIYSPSLFASFPSFFSTLAQPSISVDLTLVIQHHLRLPVASITLH